MFSQEQNEISKTRSLSQKAINDLRSCFRKSYGEDFDTSLNDDQISNLGVLILTGLVESLKMEIVSPELFAPKV
jgi:hypothetical protein